MNKILSYITFIILFIVMILVGVYTVISLGSNYIEMYFKVGFKGMVIAFCIGIVFYGILFYGLYRVDLKVRSMLKKG